MPIFDLFSKRKKNLARSMHDVYLYDKVPYKLRVQIIQIIEEKIGNYVDYHAGEYFEKTKKCYQFIVVTLRKEYGKYYLNIDHSLNTDYRIELLQFIQKCTTDEFLDCVELSAKVIEDISENSEKRIDTLNEINVRFRESSFGFQYEDGKFIRFDNEFAHKEITKPAINILQSKHLNGAREEFLNAHEHYRNRKYKESITDCAKSLESTLKAICVKRKWNALPNATAKSLLETCFANKLIPDYMKSHFTALQSVLESGVPTIRNKASAHGQGVTPKEVPDHLAAFVLHQTAAAIIFLDKSEVALI